MSRPTTRIITLGSIALLCGVGVSTQLTRASDVGDTRPIYQLAAAQPSSAAAAGAPMQAGAPVDQRERARAADTGTVTVQDTSVQADGRSATVADARAFSAAFAEVAATATPAVVQIRTERSLGMESHFNDWDRLPEGHPSPDTPYMSDGTGFLVSDDGLILTNNHVIAGAERIHVILWDRRVYDATVLGTDPTTDLALVVVDERDLPHVRLGDSEALKVGEWVLAIGNPGFRDDHTLDFTVTSGIVSAKGRPLRVIQDELAGSGDPAARYAIEDFIQTDAAINPGNSGGPLLDLNGDVVGINTAIASVNGVNQGYGFAVPINVARRVIRDLLEHGHVRRPLLGISIASISPEDAQVYGLSRIAGVLVEDFAEDSPAQRAGMQRHDVIVGIDGVGVERLGQFQRMVAARDPGETVQVDVVRYGQRLQVPVRLTEADLGNRRVVRTDPTRSGTPGLGVELVDLTPALARERRFRRPGGALVAEVSPGSAAARKNVSRGLVIREINRTPVHSAREADRLLDALPAGAVASLMLEDPRGQTLIRNVRIP